MLKLGRLISLLGAAVLLLLPASTISAQDTGACAYEEPAWAPDGNSLLFSSMRDGDFEIYSVRPNGRDLQRLTNHAGSDAAAAWSPDGRLIVLDSDREGASTLYLMNGTGNDVRLLSADLGHASVPVWSPDGRAILFEGRYGENRDLFRVGANGRNVERLTTDAANDFRPAPSPNSEWIAFQSKRSGTYQIHLMASDGSTVEQLTHGASNSASPSWSPDGRRVAFMSDRSGNDDIYVMTLGDRSVARLTTDPGMDRAPRWSPDGRDIAFLSNRGGRPGLYLMSSDGSKQVLVIEGCADPTGGDNAQDRTTELALSLLPGEARSGASVVIRNGEGETMVRSGSGSFLCVIDANNAARLSLNCHDRRLILLLHMEREVGAAGLRGAAFREELCTRVEAEAAEPPTGLLEISASVEITSEGQLADSMTVYHLLYTPNETSASLGLRDDDPGAGAPWLHNAGSCNAHVMWSERRATAQESWTEEQRQVLAAMERLSAATAPGGAGADEYGAVLAEEFSRWTVGSTVIDDKQAWVESLREWFDEGWRVSDRQTRNLEILVKGNYAFTRRIVEETYLGPEGERSVSAAALAEVWVRGDSSWLLLLVNVHPLDSP